MNMNSTQRRSKMSSNIGFVVTGVNQTHIKRETYDFTWIVKNFDKEVSFSSRKRFISTSFDTAYGPIKFNFYPDGFNDENPDMDFEIRAEINTRKSVCSVICLIDKNGEEHFHYEDEDIVDRIYRTEHFAERSQINSDFLPNNCLTIKIKFYFSLEDEHFEKIPVFGMEILPEKRRLEEFDDFEKLLIDSRFSDIKIIIDKQTFYAHKNILAARSPYFSSMFESNMKELEEGEIHITNVSAKIMQEILRFIYTGKIITNEETVITDLLFFADMYGLDGLIEISTELVASNMDTSNIGTILILIERLGNNRKMKDFAIEFLTKNAKVLLKNESFRKELNSLSPSFMAEMITIMMSKM